MKNLLFLLFILCFPLLGNAQEFPEKPNPPRLVNDYTNTLSPEEVNALEQKLLIYNDTTSTQIAIVMISSLDGYPVDDYAIQLAERWGIGQKGKDNGVLIFIAKDDRKIFIPTGYGMEGVMPDGLVKRIIETDIKPAFKEGRYYDGLDQATNSMFRLAAGEYQAEPKKKSGGPPVIFILGIIFFVFMIFFVKVRSVKQYSALNNIPFWAAWTLLNQATRTHHGTWGGFSGGGGSSWGGGGGGGFGGFGGGSFGGGGAGGSW
ncbi:MAG TPA: TPM domain-containing protein [Bacteroidia bacterium]|nr:TPM domain-containing protein [Bacteroidia bacterium]